MVSYAVYLGVALLPTLILPWFLVDVYPLWVYVSTFVLANTVLQGVLLMARNYEACKNKRFSTAFLYAAIASAVAPILAFVVVRFLPFFSRSFIDLLPANFANPAAGSIVYYQTLFMLVLFTFFYMEISVKGCTTG